MSAPQLDLLGSVPAGSQPVETSERAADRLTPHNLAERRHRVLLWFQSRGEYGGTADELEAAFGLGHNATSPRVTELTAMGFLVRCDGRAGVDGSVREYRRRSTRQGGTGFVHEITARGIRELARRSEAAA